MNGLLIVTVFVTLDDLLRALGKRLKVGIIRQRAQQAGDDPTRH